MMKFVYTEGNYREFRGYVFWNHRPVTITDRATEEALLKDKSFRRVDDELDQAPQAQAVEAHASPKVLDPHACPKCGRIVKQGKVLHIKHCKGKK